MKLVAVESRTWGEAGAGCFLFVFNYVVEFCGWTVSTYKAVRPIRTETLVYHLVNLFIDGSNF